MNLSQRLLELARQNKLAHFYILEPTKSSPQGQAECEHFLHQFLQAYFQLTNTASPASAWDHPDVLTLGQRSEQEEITSNFTVDEALSFMRYFEFAPVSAPHKFAIITQASRVTTTVANKWLKLLEEPNGQTTIILINANRLKLLPTIESRAILLRLPNAAVVLDQQEFQDFLSEAQNQSLSEFIDKNQKAARDLNYWSEQLIIWETEQNSGMQEKARLGQWLTQLKEMDTFHQPSATKWALFYQHLQSNVFGRLIH